MQVFSLNQAAPAASTTYYISGFASAPGVNAGIIPMYVQFPATLMHMSLKAVVGTPASAETGTVSVRVNNTTDYVVTSAMQWNANVNVGYYAIFGLGVPLIADELAITDYFEIKIATPAWLTPPLNVIYSGVLAFAGGF